VLIGVQQGVNDISGTEINRRNLVWLLGLGAVAPGIVATASANPLSGHANTRIVVVGAGPGGLSAARTIRGLLPESSVTLIEPQPEITTCYFSNHYIAGLQTQASIIHSLANVAEAGIELVRDWVVRIDRDGRTVQLKGGAVLSYDRLILSPGIELDSSNIEGYGPSEFSKMPHAWSGRGQSQLLHDQLQAMPDGGLFIIAPPPMPYRCPPAPYERASLVANYFKSHKPKSKILILDGKTGFPNQALFEDAWNRYYPGMIDWIPVDFSGGVTAVDATTMTVQTDAEEFKADVINIIPPQRAGSVTHQVGLVDESGWCPVEASTFRSQLEPHIHIVGDSIAGHLPKSAYSAATEGVLCGAAIVAELNDQEPSTSAINTACWSLVHPDNGIVIQTTYENQGNDFEAVAAQDSTLGDSDVVRAQVARDAEVWYATLTATLYGTSGS
jgi:sulfide dehydrogenase [flavocytochrome c] flavoprotein subunit